MPTETTLAEEVRKLAAEVDRLKDEPKDVWDIVSVIGALCIPLTIALVGHWYTAAQDNASSEQAAANAAVEQAKLVESFLDSIASTDPRRQRIALTTLKFAVPSHAETIHAGIHSGASIELKLAIAAGEMEFSRLDREAGILIRSAQEILDVTNDMTYEQRLIQAQQLVATIRTSFPEMVTPANVVILADAAERIDKALVDLREDEGESANALADRVKSKVLVELHGEKIAKAIEEWELLKSTTEGFLGAATDYAAGKDSKGEVDAEYGKVLSAFLARLNTSSPPRLLQILEQRIYPAVTLMELSGSPKGS